MDVILKKTKITKSIVSQSLRGNNSLFIDKKNYEILGWCVHKYRYILLYSNETNQILKLPYIHNYDYSITHKTEQTLKEGLPYQDWYFPTFYYLIIRFYEFNSEHTIIRSLNESDVTNGVEKLKQFLDEVYQKGQIYL